MSHLFALFIQECLRKHVNHMDEGVVQFFQNLVQQFPLGKLIHSTRPPHSIVCYRVILIIRTSVLVVNSQYRRMGGCAPGNLVLVRLMGFLLSLSITSPFYLWDDGSITLLRWEIHYQKREIISFLLINSFYF